MSDSLPKPLCPQAEMIDQEMPTDLPPGTAIIDQLSAPSSDDHHLPQEEEDDHE